MAGQKYLLFLVRTGLKEDPPYTFYVTGGVAGIYRWKGDGYVHLGDDGDDAPQRLVPDELRWPL